jgi:uncharacterized protein YecT (DUF1311 family)
LIAYGVMRYWRLLALLPLIVLGTPPASAEMFGADYKPCGDKQSTVDIVACVTAKTKAWDDRLNEAYKGVQKRISAGQRQPLAAAEQLWIKYRDANCGFYAAADGTIRQVMAAECMRSMTQDRALELEKAMKLGD